MRDSELHGAQVPWQVVEGFAQSEPRYLLTTESKSLLATHFTSGQKDALTHLVAVTPLVVLGPDVLVRVLGALLQRRHVAPVLPVLAPEVVSVSTGEGHDRGDAAKMPSAIVLVTSPRQCHPPLRNRPNRNSLKYQVETH